MKKIGLFALAVAVLACGIAQRTEAAGPSFTYQGVIREVGGAAATGNKTVEFRIYNTPNGGTALWGRSYSVLLDSNGLFNTALTDSAGSALVGGDGIAKILADNAGTTLYIGITVQGSSGEISPRQAILAVPYAIHAADAVSSSGNFTVYGSETVNGGLTVNGYTRVNGLEANSLAVNGNISAGSGGVVSGFGTIPVGGIIMWSGNESNIPEGWALCNGQWMNGQQTPDLRGRFIVGAGQGNGLSYYGPNWTGGAETVTLTVDQMPSHSHSKTMRVSGYSGSRSALWEVLGDDANGVVAGWRTYTTDSTGGGGAHENRPPYYALCYIMRVK